MRLASRALAIGVAATVATAFAIARADRGTDAPRAPDAAACAAFAVTPASARVGFGDSIVFRSAAGSGRATFSLQGDGAGAVVLAGGGVRAGDRAASFDVSARDDACGTTVRAHVDVVLPLTVTPRVARVRAGGSVRFTAQGGVGAARFRVVSGPAGASILDDGTFVATHEGHWLAEAADREGGRAVALVVDATATLAPLRPRAPVLAVVAGGRAPLVWSGGSGSLDVDVAPSIAHVERAADDFVIALSADAPPAFDVRATDRVTREVSTVRVLVARPFAEPPTAHGDRTPSGDVAAGDFNGDGHADLAVGDATRSLAGVNAGGVLLFYGHDDGTFGRAPDLVIEGAHADDRFGSTLLALDIDQNGADDLVVAAVTADLGEADRGSVSIYAGSRAGLSKIADRVLGGEAGGNHFGSAIAARDLDGNGTLDLVVGSPMANHVQGACGRGRAYVYRGRANVRGIVEAAAWQTIDLADPIADAADGALTCPRPPIDPGEALAILDVDGDGALDLAVGAPGTPPAGGSSADGAVDVFRGAKGGMLGATPAWAIHLAPGDRVANERFGGGLDVVPTHDGDTLVVRATQSLPKDAKRFWAFPPKSLGEPGAAPRVRVVTTEAARGSFAGAAGEDGLVGDLDGDGAAEYVVADAVHAPASRLLSFAADHLSGRIAPTATIDLPSGTTDLRLAAWRGAKGSADGLAIFALTRSTSAGPFAGAVDVVAPSAPMPLATRLTKRVTLDLPAFGAGDEAGASIAFAHTGPRGALEILVGAPSRASTGDPPRTPATAVINAGRVERFAASTLVADGADLEGSHMNDAFGRVAPVALDFDGDGSLELAIFVPHTPPHGAVVDPDGCLATARDGAVRIFARDGDGYVDRAYVVSSALAGFPPPSSNLGGSFTAADVDGDGKSDLVVERAIGVLGAIETVHGRAFVPGKIVIACARAGDAFPSAWPPPFLASSPKSLVSYGERIAPLGDVDRDGCEDVAFSYGRRYEPGPTWGLAIAFGYDASGARCSHHKEPLVIHLAGDGLALADDVVGVEASRANDLHDVSRVHPASAFPTSSGDVTGDGVPDLVFADGELHDATGGGPAVEIVSGAALAKLCPNHACPAGHHGAFWADGEFRAFGFGSLGPAERVVLRGDLEHAFGTSIALADLDGDRVSEIAVGIPDARGAAPFTGAARVFRLGKHAPAVWIDAYGDAAERTSFGASVALVRDGGAAWLGVGAPSASRGGTGVGAAYAFRVDPGSAR